MAETIALTKLVVKVKHMLASMAGLTPPQEGETVINCTCVWTNNTATLSVAKGDNFTHETAVSSRMYATQYYHISAHKNNAKYCRYFDQAVSSGNL